MGWVSKLETQERVAVQVQRHAVVEPGRADVGEEVQGQSAGRFSLALGRLVFVLGLQTDWMRSTHIMDGNLLYSKSTN